MTEQVRENYFLAVKMLLVLVSEIYLLVIQFERAGASGEMFLLLALFFGSFIIQELQKDKWRICFLCLSGLELCLFIHIYGEKFWVLGILLGYEIISYARENFSEKIGIVWYAIPILLIFILVESEIFLLGVFVLFTGIIYIQHDFIIASYRKQVQEDTLSEQDLKKNMNRQKNAMREELKRGLLVSENQMLEERARLSQTLHDKLGHNINGSVYQLEAVKVLMEKEPETSKKMIQAVINQLRTGMDEIRSILRKERPPKYKLAMLQLQRLCEECKSMNIEAQVVTEGELSEVPENYLEIILDNAFEAVSNALKYAHCTKLEIKIIVMNQMLRCSISNNGVGCSEVVEGMGITGMRERVRSVNGILDLATEVGFTINMLLPMKRSESWKK